MNKHNAKDYLPLVQALADGKVIQVLTTRGWRDAGDITFNWAPDQYRTKPDPRVIWVNTYKDGSMGAYASEDKAITMKEETSFVVRTAKFLEVLED